MSTENKQLCMGCMEYIDENAEVCPLCGHVKNFDGNIKHILPGGAVINERYIFGTCKQSDGEGIVYIALDKVANEKVYIKEFAPFSICDRGEDGYTILPKVGCEVKFKALYFDFRDLCANLSELSSSVNIVPLIDYFEKNGTVYAVYKFLSAMTLEQYLRYNGGAISWLEAKKMFSPIFGVLEVLEENNILHRGISPETILIDTTGKVYLSGFSIASNRTCFSEIPETIEKYYAAPEQYEASGWQGTWTDVFALSATLFRTLTGNTPLEAAELIKGTRSPNPNFIDKTIPQNVSDAILNGMIPDTKERIQNCSLLLEELLDCQGGNTTVFNVSDLKSKENSNPNKIEDDRENDEDVKTLTEKEESKSSGKQIVLGLIIAVVAIILLSFAINFYVFSPSQDKNQADEQQSAKEYVPLFVGKQVNTIIGSSALENKFSIKYVYEFNSDIPDGQIYKQEPSVSTPVDLGEEITLYVSKGANKLIVPALIGEDVQAAMQILDQIGIKYSFEVAKDVEATAENENTVYGTTPVAGEEIDIDRDKVILYIVEMDKE